MWEGRAELWEEKGRGKETGSGGGKREEGSTRGGRWVRGFEDGGRPAGATVRMKHAHTHGVAGRSGGGGYRGRERFFTRPRATDYEDGGCKSGLDEGSHGLVTRRGKPGGFGGGPWLDCGQRNTPG